ncbi:21714_t:CDS:2, partial [Dentiscutata erythropus]
IVYSKIPERFQEVRDSIINYFQKQINKHRQLQHKTQILTSILALTNTLQPFTGTSGTTLPLASSSTIESNMTLTVEQLKEFLKKVTDGFKETAQFIKFEMHEKIVMLVALDNTNVLADIMKNAAKIEAGRYYIKKKKERNLPTSQNIETKLDG